MKNSNQSVPVLVFAEETETELGNRLLQRTDIDPILLRFKKSQSFSEEYLNKTSKVKQFVLDTDSDVAVEAQRFKEWCESQTIRPTHFFNDSEYFQDVAQGFARRSNLPALSEEQVAWVRDKVYMKDKLRALGLSVMNYTPVEDGSDINEFLNQGNKFPLMFKRRRGFASVDAYKLNNMEDFNNLPVMMKPNTFMVEAFNNDSEWILDSLVQDNAVIDTYVSYVPVSPLFAVVENRLNAHITTPEVPEFFNFKPTELIQTIATGMNLQNGYMHLEAFINKKGDPTICEFGWRLAGCQIPMDHCLAYGFDIYDQVLNISVGKKANLDYSSEKRCVGDLYLPNKEGIITKLSPLEKILAHEGAIGGKLFVKEGENRRSKRAGNDASGYIFVEGPSIEKVEARMHNIFENFEIEAAKIGNKSNPKFNI